MNRMHRIALVLALVATIFVPVACSPTEATTSNFKDAMALLPQFPIPVDFDDEGRVTQVAGLSTGLVDTVFESMTGQKLVGGMRILPPAYIRWFKRSNIQHVTLSSRPEGLFILVNGEALPYIAWDGESMENLATVLGKFEHDGKGAYLISPEYQDNVVENLLPTLPMLNVRLILRFPVDSENEAIPLPEDVDFDDAVAATEGDDSEPMQRVDLHVTYVELPEDQGWVPSLSGLSTVDLRQLLDSFGMTFPRYRLRQDIERRIENEKLEGFGLEARHDGIFVVVDTGPGEDDTLLLPHLAWSDKSLATVSRLLEQLYPPGTELPRGAAWVPVVRSTAPLYNDFAVALVVDFPTKKAAAQ